MESSVRHLQSSTQIIKLGEVSILTDPWLTEGEYMGSWFHYPPFNENEILNLKYDFIYVSHIHPDHLSEKTFKKLPKKVPVFILKYSSNFLRQKIESFGFEVIELRNTEKFKLAKDTFITIYAADNCNPIQCFQFFGCGKLENEIGSSQIDSMALFEFNNTKILNTNDCPFELAENTILKHSLYLSSIDLLLVGYAGAGAYPQCFTKFSPEEMAAAAETKKISFLHSAISYVNLINPKVFAPFAGTYILGSKLAHLSDFRGVPKIPEAIDYIMEKKQVPAVGIYLESNSEYFIERNEIIKYKKDNKIDFQNYKNYISTLKLDYEDDIWDEGITHDMVLDAYKRFKNKSKELNFKSNTIIYLCTDKVIYSFGTNKDIEMIKSCKKDIDYLKITLHNNLLNRLIRGPKYAHWNNAEIGSHLQLERKPDVYERGLFLCLSYFHI